MKNPEPAQQDARQGRSTTGIHSLVPVELKVYWLPSIADPARLMAVEVDDAVPIRCTLHEFGSGQND